MFTATVIVSVLLGLASIGSAAGKLTEQPRVVDMLTGIGVPPGWLPRLAVLELAGGAGLLIGLAVAPIGIAAATGLVCYFIGAVITHVRARDNAIAAPAMLAAISLAALILRVATL